MSANLMPCSIWKRRLRQRLEESRGHCMLKLRHIEDPEQWEQKTLGASESVEQIKPSKKGAYPVA